MKNYIYKLYPPKNHKIKSKVIKIDFNSLPQQLVKQRFILLNKSNDAKEGKKPLEKNWTKDKNYSYEEIIKTNETKYGVLCGYNNLVVVDCDSLDFQEKFLLNPEFKNTFVVKSAGKGLYHFYYYVDEDSPQTHRLDQFSEDGKRRLADIQGKGTQVLGPNSKIGEKSYDIVNDVPIKSVSFIDLLAYCKSVLPNMQMQSHYEKKRKEVTIDEDDDYIEIDPVISYIKSKITIRDLLEEIGINTKNGRNCECPHHTSENGQCLSYDNHQYHCFHCSRGGSMFDFVMEYNNCDFQKAKEILAEKVGVPPEVIKKATELIIKAKKAEATEFLVKKFINGNHVYTIRNDLKPEMWIYSSGIYIPHAKTFIKAFVRATLGNYYTSHVCNQVINKIEADTFIEEEKFFNNVYPNIIPVKNGLLNVIDKTISPFNPDKIFFNKYNVFYDCDKTSCPKILNFLQSSLATEEDLITIQEIFGYILLNNCKFKKGFMFIGDGDNGKSVAIDLLSEFIGHENVSNVSIQSLDDDQYSASGLFGKVANINADIGKGKLVETSMLKNLISGDTIYANRKFLTPIKFRNVSKMIFAANKLPETEDETDGFFTRWVIIEFPYSFKREHEYNNLDADQLASNKYKLADPYIFEKITSEEELTGFLNWVMLGLDRLIKRKEFTKNSSVDKLRMFWVKKSSSMKAYILDNVEFTYDDNDFIVAGDLRVEYINYCKLHNLKPQMKKDCTNILNDYPIKYKSKKFSTGSGTFENKRIWEGLKLKRKVE